MAITPDTFDVRYGDGVTDQFTFDFPYLSQNDVYVEVDGVATGFTFLSGNTLELTSVPADGAEVYIYRNTPAATPAYEFNLGDPFLPKFIDENFTQLLYAVQEGLDFYQQLESQVIRVTDSTGLDPLPLAAERAGKFLSFDENGDPVVKVPSENTAEGLGAALSSIAPGFGASLVSMEGGPSVEEAVTQAEVGIQNRVIRVSSVAELETLSLDAGTAVYLTEEHRPGPFLVKSGAHGADPQKAVFVDLANGNYAVRQFGQAVATSGELRAEWFNVLAANDGADEYQQWADALTFASQIFDGAQGAYLRCKAGVTEISQTLVLPNRVAVAGPNGRGLVFKPHSTFASSYMFDAVNGTSSMFGSRLEDCYIDARGFNMVAPIRSQAWQETCGLRRVVIQYDGTTPYGFYYETGYGGAAYLPFEDVEIFCDSTAAVVTPIFVDTVLVGGGFVLSIDGLTIAGTATNPVDRGIFMENDSLYVKGYHVEYCNSAITMNGAGSLSVDTITGSNNDVVDLISYSASFTGKVSARNIIPGGATGSSVKNNITGTSIPASLGMIPEYVYPSVRSENTALAWVVFDGATGAIQDAFNVSSVTRSAAGQYTINYATTLPAGERSISWSTNVDSADAVVVAATGSTATTDSIRVRRLGGFSGAYYDAQRVKITVFGNSVV
jgi:hypothetical protein